MLNIQPSLDSRLWEAIETNYQLGNFTGAIQDSIYFLSQLIRDRSGLDGDGAPLVGDAFGGANPRLKINSLQTDSDKNVQKGVHQILVGLYLGIRNPRMHDKHSDTADQAEPIILFVNYLVKLIDRSKSPFELDTFLERVFDAAFPENDHYAELIVAEIPERKQWETFLAVYRNKETRGRYPRKLRHFIKALMKAMTQDEIESVCQIVSEELCTTHSEATVLKILQIIPDEYWMRYREVARIRTESKLIASMLDGRSERDGLGCTAGVFGTWAINIAEHFVLKNELVAALITKLRSKDIEQQDYALEYFVKGFPVFLTAPSVGLKLVLREGLKVGDVRFYESMFFLDKVHGEEFKQWRLALGIDYDNFVEKKREEPASVEITDEDDVPF